MLLENLTRVLLDECTLFLLSSMSKLFTGPASTSAVPASAVLPAHAPPPYLYLITLNRWVMARSAYEPFFSINPIRKKTLYGKVSSNNKRTEAEKGSVCQVSKELLVKGLSVSKELLVFSIVLQKHCWIFCFLRCDLELEWIWQTQVSLRFNLQRGSMKSSTKGLFFFVVVDVDVIGALYLHKKQQHDVLVKC